MKRRFDLAVLSIVLFASPFRRVDEERALSDCFVLERAGSMGSFQQELWVREPNGSQRKIGWLTDKTPNYAVSQDGRSVVFHNQWAFHSDGKRIAAGIHRYVCGVGDSLLHPDREIGVFGSPPSFVPSDRIVFWYADASRSPRGMRWTVAADGTEEPLPFLDGTPLHGAALRGRLGEIDSLLSAGFDPTQRDRIGLSAIDLALWVGQEPAAQRMCDAAQADSALRALVAVRAILYGRWDVVTGLVKRGLDSNAAVGDRTLLTATLDHPYRPWEDDSSLEPFRRVGSSEDEPRPPASILVGVRSLLSLGADPNRKDGRGATPLHAAAVIAPFPEGAEAARVLLAAGANPNLATARGNTPLHTLVGNASWNSDATDHSRMKYYREGGFPGTLDALLSGTTDLEARNREGLTPLQRAIEAGNFLAAHTLVEHGASDTVSYHGYVVRDILAEEKKKRHGDSWWKFRNSFHERYGGPRYDVLPRADLTRE